MNEIIHHIQSYIFITLIWKFHISKQQVTAYVINLNLMRSAVLNKKYGDRQMENRVRITLFSICLSSSNRVRITLFYRGVVFSF